MNVKDVLIGIYTTIPAERIITVWIVGFATYMTIFWNRQKRTKEKLTILTVLKGALLGMYLIFVLGGTLLGRESGQEYKLRLIPFASYVENYLYPLEYVWMQILYNVILFIPAGFFWPIWVPERANWRGVFWFGFCLSAMIELVQLVFKMGIFETDDFIHNVLGALVGFSAWKLWSLLKNRLDHKIEI